MCWYGYSNAHCLVGHSLGDARSGSAFIYDHGTSAFDDRDYIANPSFSIVLAVPLCIFALGCHLQVIPLFGELPNPVRPRFPAVVVSTVASCGLLYIVTGFFGYIEWGDGTNSDVLTNFDLGDTLVSI